MRGATYAIVCVASVMLSVSSAQAACQALTIQVEFQDGALALSHGEKDNIAAQLYRRRDCGSIRTIDISWTAIDPGNARRARVVRQAVAEMYGGYSAPIAADSYDVGGPAVPVSATARASVTVRFTSDEQTSASISEGADFAGQVDSEQSGAAIDDATGGPKD